MIICVLEDPPTLGDRRARRKASPPRPTMHINKIEGHVYACVSHTPWHAQGQDKKKKNKTKQDKTKNKRGTHVCASVFGGVRTHTHTYTYSCTHTYTYSCTHTRKYSCTHTRLREDVLMGACVRYTDLVQAVTELRGRRQLAKVDFRRGQR